MERKTARLTVLLDPARKLAFEQACHARDLTPSQVVRQLIRDYTADAAAKGPASRPVRPSPKK